MTHAQKGAFGHRAMTYTAIDGATKDLVPSHRLRRSSRNRQSALSPRLVPSFDIACEFCHAFFEPVRQVRFGKLQRLQQQARG